jgi:hypothetical protein
MSQTVVIYGRLSQAALTLVVLLFTWSGAAAQTAPDFPDISPAAADSLGGKIQAILRAEGSSDRESSEDSVSVSEVEMESFVLYWMVDEIPPLVESIDVTVTEASISAAAQLTFDEENSSGNSIVDGLLGGTHEFFVRGALQGQDGRGAFELLEVRVDGLGVPLFIVDLLVVAFVTPRFPDVDLNEPFDLPWGIESLLFSDGALSVGY